MKGFLRPSPNGSGYTVRPVYIGLGAYPLIRLSEAREIAIDNARMAAHGGDPRQPKIDAVPTFAELAEVEIEQGAASWATDYDERLASSLWRGTSSQSSVRGPLTRSPRQDLLERSRAHQQRPRPTAAEKIRRYVGTVHGPGRGPGTHRSDNPAVAVQVPATGERPQDCSIKRPCLTRRSARPWGGSASLTPTPSPKMHSNS